MNGDKHDLSAKQCKLTVCLDYTGVRQIVFKGLLDKRKEIKQMGSDL
jgi:hypothetical protein